MTYRIIPTAILLLFCSWALPGTIQAGAGSPGLQRPSAPKSSYPARKISPASHAVLKNNAAVGRENEKIEEENELIENMEEERKKLEDELNELSKGGGG
jgi:hypothetical protein